MTWSKILELLFDKLPWIIGAFFGWRLLYKERKDAENKILLKQSRDREESQRKYNDTLKAQVKRADEYRKSHKDAIEGLDDLDPRYNDALFEDAAAVLDDIHGHLFLRS